MTHLWQSCEGTEFLPPEQSVLHMSEASLQPQDPHKPKPQTEPRQWMIRLHRLQDPHPCGCFWTISHVERNADRARWIKWKVATENMSRHALQYILSGKDKGLCRRCDVLKSMIKKKGNLLIKMQYPSSDWFYVNDRYTANHKDIKELIPSFSLTSLTLLWLA